MKLFVKTTLATIGFVAGFTGTTFADSLCGPRVTELLKTNTIYGAELSAVQNNIAKIDADVGAYTHLPNDATYSVVFSDAETLRGDVLPGSDGARVVIADPDGVVMVDTAKPACLGNIPHVAGSADGDSVIDSGTINSAACNSNQNYLHKDVNENMNTRVSFLEAQSYPCGLGVETKFSTSVQTTQAYTAVRLGSYLQSNGTVSVSVNAE